MREVFEVLYRFGRELDLVPEYRREFFDNPVKCPLLIPRVLDLRQDFSDPTTCYLQKYPQSKHVDEEPGDSEKKDPRHQENRQQSEAQQNSSGIDLIVLLLLKYVFMLSLLLLLKCGASNTTTNHLNHL